MTTILNKTSTWKRQKQNARPKSSEACSFAALTSSSSCSITETLPSPVGPTSFSRSLFSSCRITECSHLHCCKIFLLSSPIWSGSTIKANVSSPRLSSESQDRWAWEWLCVCVCGGGFLQQPAAQINTSNINPAGLWNLVMEKNRTHIILYQ